MTHPAKTLKMTALSAVLVMSFAATPARADHNRHDNVLAPLAAFVVLGSLLRHNQGHEHRAYKRRHGHYGHIGYGQKAYKHKYKHKRKIRSYSAEGYTHNYKPKRRH